MGEHHEYGPSNYNAWKHCIYWRGSKKDTAESSAGTHHHEELSKSLNDLNYEPDTYVARWASDQIKSLCPAFNFKSEIKVVGKRDGIEGIFGTVDVLWVDEDNRLHIADLKSFSDGTEDYSPQLMGYAALWLSNDMELDMPVILHVLHGGICKVETIETTMKECVNQTILLVDKVKAGTDEHNLCKACQYCSNIKECPMANGAVSVVQGGGAVDFSKMSLPQKLVVCEAVEKLIKTLKEDAKQQAIENGGVLEADGIKFEIKEHAGKGKVHDLCELAAAVGSVKVSMGYEGITNEELLALCELPKTKFVQAMKDANAERKDVKKKDIEAWCAGFYDKGENQQVLTRVQ